MNVKRFVLASVVVFVFAFLFDFLVHGVVLKGAYEQTADLWRPPEEAKMGFMLFSQLCFSFMAGFIFTRHFEGKGIGEGLRFGLYIGLFLATLEIGKYGYMPVPLFLPMAWFVGSTLKGVGAGLLLGFTYKK